MKSDLFAQDHYRVLGVDRNATHGTIREAYLRLVKKHHPDVSKGAQSEEQFKAIASAWEVRIEPFRLKTTTSVSSSWRRVEARDKILPAVEVIHPVHLSVDVSPAPAVVKDSVRCFGLYPEPVDAGDGGQIQACAVRRENGGPRIPT